MALLAFAVLVFSGFPASLMFQSAGQRAPLGWSTILGCLLVGTLIVFGLRFVGPPLVKRASHMLADLPSGSLNIALATGLAVRIVWVLAVQPEPSSDGLAYLSLAQGLLDSGAYRLGDTRAYWPPGVVFVLVPFLLITPSTSVALSVYGLVFFLVAAFGTHRLSRRAGLGKFALLPVWLLAVWPGHLMMTGLPEKELIIMAIVPWAAAMAIDSPVSLRHAVATGVAVGAMVLVQPSLQLLPVFCFVGAVLLGGRIRPSVRALSISIVCMLILVAPWSIRNWYVLGEPVLVSTNGGSNLYRANNELATGAYIAKGRVDVEAMSEIESNREGKRLALEWIREHRLEFLQLSATRILLFPGDHSYATYAAFRSRQSPLPRAGYLGLKAAVALPWLLLWALIASMAWSLKMRGTLTASSLWILLTPHAYLSAIHSIFESGSKYHLPAALPLLVLVVALLIATRSLESNAEQVHNARTA